MLFWFFVRPPIPGGRRREETPQRETGEITVPMKREKLQPLTSHFTRVGEPEDHPYCTYAGVLQDGGRSERPYT